MPECRRCTILPDEAIRTGILRIAPPVAHSCANLRRYLERAGIAFSMPTEGLLEVRLEGDLLDRLVGGLDGVLSPMELRDTRALIVSEGVSPSSADLSSVLPLATLIARVQGAWFHRMLGESRLTSFFQPIVAADDPEDIFAFECLLRGRAIDGSLIPPDQLYRVAREADLLFPLDQSARLTAIRTAAEHGLDTRGIRIFINFNPSSIYNPVYCLRSTIAAIAETSFTPDRITFEIVESDHIHDIAHLVRIVDHYRGAGFRVALDDLGSGFGSLNLLGQLRPDFVKLDMGLIRGVDRDPYRAGIVQKLLEMARDLGIRSVAEGVETEEEWDWVRYHGADFVQGYLFARPACPPPQPALRRAQVDQITVASL